MNQATARRIGQAAGSAIAWVKTAWREQQEQQRRLNYAAEIERSLHFMVEGATTELRSTFSDPHGPTGGWEPESWFVWAHDLETLVIAVETRAGIDEINSAIKLTFQAFGYDVKRLRGPKIARMLGEQYRTDFPYARYWIARLSSSAT